MAGPTHKRRAGPSAVAGVALTINTAIELLRESVDGLVGEDPD